MHRFPTSRSARRRRWASRAALVALVTLLCPGRTAVADVAALLADPAADATQRGLAVARAADAADAGFGDSRAAVRMVLHDARGGRAERALRIHTLEGDEIVGDRTLLHFDAPADQRGTALLTWNQRLEADDQWLFLPALRRVKKIAVRNRSGPFVGSEFAFEDLTTDEVSAFEWRYLDAASCDVGRCYRIERRPVEASSGYARQIAYYDTEALRLVRVEYHDRKDVLLKTLRTDDWSPSAEGYWRAGYMEMVNHQTGRRTELFWSPHQFGTGLSESDFTVAALRRTR